MKLFLIFTMLFSLNAMAEPIIIDIGGIRHECSPVGNGNSTQCFKVAYAGNYSKEESLRLCAGAYSDAPARCAAKAYLGRFSKAESIDLCIGATTNTGPVDCADLAYSGPFSSAQSMELCRQNGSRRNVTCALEAYRGPFSRDEAIEMCKNPRFVKEHSMRSENEYSDSELLNLIKEANNKLNESNQVQ